ncbi:flavin oxidoreductase/NADH oxidase [uncultured Agathobaculum sp.]|uniref:oxidoreductase n=1 Tax=uncultured Agathobaculum sp. TaxID=2048140 RepID=UPI00296E3725
MEHKRFHYKSMDELKQELTRIGVRLPLSDSLEALKREVKLGARTMHNSIAIQPMEGCDGTADGRPAELTLRRYDRFARSGAGLIWAEAVAITPEGRANPRQLWLTRDNLDDYKRFVYDMKQTCLKENGFEPIVIMQATHSGRYSKPEGVPAPLIAYNNPIFEGDRPIAADRILSDEYLYGLIDKFGVSASLAEQAGFDGVDIKCCHRYLNSELLSAYDREGDFGGSLENRTRLLRGGVAAAQAATGSDFIVTSRLNVYDGFPHPYGWGVREDEGTEIDLTEPLELVRILHREMGMKLLDVTIGNPYFNPHVNRPYDGGPYVPQEHPLEGVARMAHCVAEIQRANPELKVISSGLSYLRQFSANLAAGELETGVCSIAGFGREAFAYPQFPHDIFTKGAMEPNKCCIACGKCTELMRAGSTAGCVIRDEAYLPIYQRDVQGKQ